MFKKKEEKDVDLSKKFGENIVDEIERLNKEFKSQAIQAGVAPSAPEMPPEPEPIDDEQEEPHAPSTPEDLEEPPEIEEQKPAKRPVKKKSTKPISTEFDSKIEQLRQRLESGQEAKQLQAEQDRMFDTFKEEVNEKMNDLIDQVRVVNDGLGAIQGHSEAIEDSQKKLEELQAHLDDVALRVREVEQIKALQKELVTVKNQVRDLKKNDELEEMRARLDDNSEKLKQLLTLVEMLAER